MAEKIRLRKYWMVVKQVPYAQLNEKLRPARKHATYEDAIKEAKRLAEKEGKPFEVLAKVWTVFPEKKGEKVEEPSASKPVRRRVNARPPSSGGKNE